MDHPENVKFRRHFLDGVCTSEASGWQCSLDDTVDNPENMKFRRHLVDGVSASEASG